MDSKLYDELDRVEQTHWWFRARRHIVWALVRRFLRREPDQRLRICELGCGTGGNLLPLAGQHDVVGVECSPQALSYAKRKLGSRVRFGRLPHEIDLPRERYDVVLMTDVLEHIEDDAASAATAISLLRPGGIVIATVPAYQWLYSPRDAHHGHFRRYSKRRFSGLWKAADARTLLLSHYNTLLFAPAAATRLASKLRDRRGTVADLKVPASRINRMLAQIMASEANLLGRAIFPFGLSLVAVARRQTTATSTMKRLAA